MECEPGTYAANRGQSECIPCPYPLASGNGSVTCSICKEGFYLKDSSTSLNAIFQNPTEHCRDCPPNANCSAGTALETLRISRGHWRAGPNSIILYPCRSFGGGDLSGKVRCAGGTTAGDDGDGYCDTQFTGPECQLCSASNHL